MNSVSLTPCDTKEQCIEFARMRFRDGNHAADMRYREMPLPLNERGELLTINEQERSVEVTMSTETMVQVIDWDAYRIVDEILLMSGVQVADQIPLLDAHRRYSISNQIGSARQIRVQGGELIGRAFWMEGDDLAEKGWNLLRQQHCKTFSIGYRVGNYHLIQPGESDVVNGKKYTASEARPLHVVTKWEVRELSQVPIPADEFAQARTKNQQTPKNSRHKEAQMQMDPRVRAFLERIGLRSDATDEQAQEFLNNLPENVRALANAEATDQNSEPAPQPQRSVPAPAPAPQQTAPAPAPQTPVVDPQAQRNAENAGRDRVLNIINGARKFGMEDLGIQLAGQDITEAEAFRQIANQFAERQQQQARPQFTIVADSSDKFRAAATDALALRSGRVVEDAAPGADTLRSFSLVEMARECLRVNSIPINGLSKMDMVGRALMTDDFDNILANVANKSLLAGWEEAMETYDQWVDTTGSVPDFKTNTVARAGEFSDLEEVPEEGEYHYGKRTDTKETFKLATYGKIFPISRQAIINDDLGALTDTPRKMGMAAKRKLGDIAYAVLTANAALNDSVALFHATHANLTTGTLSSTSIAAAIKLMKLQKDLQSLQYLNILAQYFIAPVTLEGTAEVFFRSSMLDMTSGSQQTNPYGGSRFTRVYDARLDADSTAQWYLAGPKGMTVKMFFLDGIKEPYMEQKQGWTVDGTEFKVRIDAVAKALDFRGLVRSSGA